MSQQERQNIFHLMMDIVWFGIAIPTTARFLSVYAIRIGASPSEVNLLVSLPGLIILFSAALSIWFQRIYPDIVNASAVSGLAFRLVFLLPVFTPLVPAEWQTYWLLFAIGFPAIAQGTAIVTFVVMMRQAVKLDVFTRLNSQRAIAMNITVALSTLALGVWLVQLPFPINYQSMFALAFLASLVSWYHIQRVKIETSSPPPQPAQLIRPWRDRQYRPLIWLIFITHITFFAINPIISVHLIDNLKFDEQFVGFFMLAELLFAAAISGILPTMERRIGNRSMIMFAMIILGASAFIIAESTSPTLLLLAGGLNGAGWAAVGVHLLGIFARVAPENELVPYTISYFQVVFAATFVGPLLGTLILNTGATIPEVLLVGAMLRISAALFAGVEGISFTLKRRAMQVR